MTCHNCRIECSRFGFHKGFQRYQCKQCKKTFSDLPDKPLDNLRVPFDKAVQITHLLVEGVGIRAIERLAGVHRDTVLAVLEVVGQKCAHLLDQKVRNVAFESVQVDELFAFVGCKERNNVNQSREIGEQYVFLGVDAQSKFILNFTVGKRDPVTTQIYIQDLKKRVQAPFQLTTDGFKPYASEVYFTFHDCKVHYAQLVKLYAAGIDGEKGFERRYSPSQCIGTHKLIRRGNPSRDRISTSYVERTNLICALVQSQIHSPHARLLKEAGQPQTLGCVVHRPFQLLPKTLRSCQNTSTSLRSGRPSVDNSRAFTRLLTFQHANRTIPAGRT